MRYNFGTERQGKHLHMLAGQSLKAYLDFFGQIVIFVILFLLRPGIVNFVLFSLLVLCTQLCHAASLIQLIPTQKIGTAKASYIVSKSAVVL